MPKPKDQEEGARVKKSHGGKREGAGRKPLFHAEQPGEPTGDYHITIPVAMAEELIALGGGRLSRGIVRLWQKTKERNGGGDGG